MHLLEGEGFGDWFSLWRKLRGKRWGLILDAVGTPLPRRLSAKKRAILPKDARAIDVIQCNELPSDVVR